MLNQAAILAKAQRRKRRKEGLPLWLDLIPNDHKRTAKVRPSLCDEECAHFDLPALQRGYDDNTNFFARVKDRAADMISSARGEMRALDATLPVDGVASMSELAGHALSALLACWIPAWRATKVDPMIALRYE